MPPTTSFKSGIVEYLVKPFQRSGVLAAITAGVAWHIAESERLQQPEASRKSITTWLDTVDPEE